MKKLAFKFALAAIICQGVTAYAADWPQWRGIARTGLSSETSWSWKWPGGKPAQLWTAQVGEGYSSVAVAGGKLYTMGNAGGQDTVSCLDAVSGKQIWKQSYPCSTGDYSGPRATPTVAEGKVYTMSREGQVFCFNAISGKIIWQNNPAKTSGAQIPQWGFAGSPLVDGKAVLVNIGTAGIALNKLTGAPIWVSGKDQAGYSSPMPFTVGGKHGVAFFVAYGVVGVDPVTGKPMFQSKWNTQYDVNAADPIFSGDSVFISSNYNRGCSLINISGGNAKTVWENRSMRNHFNSCVLIAGYLYGNDQGTLKCIELSTGIEKWSSRGIGKGGIISASGKLIVLGERGELIIADANPSKYNEIARAQVLQGNCWTHPVLANGMIYCRSHEGTLVCVNARG